MFITLLASTRPGLLSAVAFDWYRSQYALCSRINDDRELNIIIYIISQHRLPLLDTLETLHIGGIGFELLCDTVLSTRPL